MMYDNYGGGGFAWVFMVFMMALFFVGVVLVIHHLNRSAHSIRKEDTALGILKNRYAKGEIEKKEFDEKRKDLKG